MIDVQSYKACCPAVCGARAGQAQSEWRLGFILPSVLVLSSPRGACLPLSCLNARADSRATFLLYTALSSLSGVQYWLILSKDFFFMFDLSMS